MHGSESYKNSGVDTVKGRDFSTRISQIAKSTHSPAVMASQTGYGGLIDLSEFKKYDNPVLVSTTDGVGTKLTLARLFDRHDTIGIDLVAMVANDILATGARPLGFLDYIACGALHTERMVAIGESIAEGCRRANASLIGGETAEHPGVMPDDEYDLAGFMTGIVEKSRFIDGGEISRGDLLIGLPSSGVHSNGLSLVRKLFLKPDGSLPEIAAEREFLLKEILLRPTVIYEKAVRPLLDSQISVKGIVHVTGGGFEENLPRILPAGLSAEVDRTTIKVPHLFQVIREKGDLEERELFSVYNMGVGLVVAVSPAELDGALKILRESWKLLPDRVDGEIGVIGSIEAENGNGRFRFA